MTPPTTPNLNFKSAWAAYRQRAERALTTHLPPPTTPQPNTTNTTTTNPPPPPPRLAQAMRYACLAGGKRLRASLVYACGEIAGATPTSLDAPAAAIELIHAYSLIHDDLPAMDDDHLRRGRPTCHLAFDQATAILAGDALHTLAFEVLSTNPTPTPNHRLQMITTLAIATGARGMAGGQLLDIHPPTPTSTTHLTHTHHLKTAALIRAATRLGALAATHHNPTLLTRLDHYATNLGLAFQIIDDILDIEATSNTTGKTHGTDQRHNKPTYPNLTSLPAAKTEAHRLCQQALTNIAPLGPPAAFLHHLTLFISPHQ